MLGGAVGREEFDALYNTFTRFVESHDAAMKAIEPLLGIVKQLHEEQTQMSHNLELQQKQISRLTDSIDVFQRVIGMIDTIAKEVERLSALKGR